ncbi:hypothetical protein [Empedobacter sp. GD03797]|uniref:hypothetical protein n=1 Tax=Empedobacter sp. GD03797 TaxID=2975382 RepID=UPI002446C7C0|nr:hypothetical protein [Empedobacter sp. GD03797]MDH1880957.1 hypothetical protein [Empedobacter sp. GD03797]
MSQEPKSIPTENLESLFYLSVKTNKNGESQSQVQLHGESIKIMSDLVCVILSEPEVEHFLKNAIKAAKGFKKHDPSAVRKLRNRAKEQK